MTPEFELANANLVEFVNVSKAFDQKSLLSDVSFVVKKHEITTLIGPNGAGKTTVARLILGLDQPTSGSIVIAPGAKIGYVPQKLDLSPDLPITAEKFLNLLAKDYNSRDYQNIKDFIDVDKYKDHDISDLSGGEFQKLLLASTLLNRPDLIILDEPIQFLDISSQQEFYRIINQIKSELKLTVFMISHDLFTVMKNSDQVICLNGHICCSGKPNDITQNKELLNTLSSIGFYTHHHNHKH
jgi:zinc transport system ATP-binding protein